MICIYCDNEVRPAEFGPTFCGNCREYKGLMTIEEWEEYTGETWE